MGTFDHAYHSGMIDQPDQGYIFANHPEEMSQWLKFSDLGLPTPRCLSAPINAWPEFWSA
jgi:hypothetical protein